MGHSTLRVCSGLAMIRVATLNLSISTVARRPILLNIEVSRRYYSKKGEYIEYFISCDPTFNTVLLQPNKPRGVLMRNGR